MLNLKAHEKPKHPLKYRAEKCPNCGVKLALSDRYCYNCGQLNSIEKLRLFHFIKEFFGNFFSYDSRFYRSLKTLTFHPGKISKDYIQGKRARYVNPFRFYISVSIIFFIFYGMTSNFSIGNQDSSAPAVIKNTENLPGVFINGENHTKAGKIAEKHHTQAELDTMSLLKATIIKLALYTTFYNTHRDPSAVHALKTLKHQPTTFNKWLYRRAVSFKIITGNPEAFTSYAIGKLPIVTFFYLPFFTLFLWLVYSRSSYTYMEHMVFVFHVQTMSFFLLGLGLIFDYFTGNQIGKNLTTLLFLIYLYMAMLYFYQQKRWKTLLKFVILNIIFIILATLALIIAVFASFAIY